MRDPDKIVLLEWEQQTEEVGWTGQVKLVVPVKFKASKQILFVTWQHKLGSGPLVCGCEFVLQKHAEARRSTQRQPGGVNAVSHIHVQAAAEA